MNEPRTVTSESRITPLERGVLLVTYALFSWWFVTLRVYLNREFPLATLRDLIDGSAYLPFQYRTLVPWLIGTINDATGIQTLTLYKSFEFLSLVGVALVTVQLLRRTFSERASYLGALGVYLILAWNFLLPREAPHIANFIDMYIPSDLPAVFFFSALIWLMLSKRWSWYYPLFAIATLNRETTCFVAIAMLFVYLKEMPRGALVKHIGAQALIWITIKVMLYLMYSNNPGSMFEIHGIGSSKTHLDANIEFLFSSRVIILLGSFAFTWIPLLLWHKMLADEPIRRALIALPVFFGAMLIIGNLNEIRIFGEFAPLVWVAFLGLFTKFTTVGKSSVHA